MQITRISIKKVVPKKGLVGFVSFVVDDSLYLGNIAIFSRLNRSSYRLVFPEKRIWQKNSRGCAETENRIPLFHPVTNQFYRQLEAEVNKKFNV